MFFLRRLIKNLLVVAALGFVVRKLISSSDPRLQRAGNIANKGMRVVFGSDATAPQAGKGRRRALRK
jgi:hypothetical protein